MNSDLPETGAKVAIIGAFDRRVTATLLIGTVITIHVTIAPKIAQNAFVVVAAFESFRTGDLWTKGRNIVLVDVDPKMKLSTISPTDPLFLNRANIEQKID